MDKLIKLMPDYGCFPLWEYANGDLIDNADPDRLPLTADLKAALRRWAAAYDATLNQEYPPDSGFPGPGEEDAFEDEGMRLWQALQDQLGPHYVVSYYSQKDGRVLGPRPEPETGVADEPRPAPSSERTVDTSAHRDRA